MIAAVGRLLRTIGVARAPLAAFVAMGVFWGTWSAVIPAVRTATGVDDAQLGRALLAVAVGALPAMLLGGRLVDRVGPWLVSLSVALFGMAAMLPAAAGSVWTLTAALLALGTASGFMDTVMNTRVSAIESLRGIRLMHLAHGSFALTFFVAATLTGVAREAGIGYPTLLVTAGLLILTAAVTARGSIAEPAVEAPPSTGRWWPTPVVVLLGLITMVAFLAENGLQSWSALHLERTLAAGAAIGGLGPGMLELAVAAGRFAGQGLAGRLGDGALIATASALGSAGAFLLALAPSAAWALVGLAIAGVGLSVIAPSAFSLVGRTATPERRGAAVAAAGVIGYTGFFIGPAVLGLTAARFGLTAAISVIALLIGTTPLLWLLVRQFRAPAPIG